MKNLRRAESGEWIWAVEGKDCFFLPVDDDCFFNFFSSRACSFSAGAFLRFCVGGGVAVAFAFSFSAPLDLLSLLRFVFVPSVAVLVGEAATVADLVGEAAAAALAAFFAAFFLAEAAT